MSYNKSAGYMNLYDNQSSSVDKEIKGTDVSFRVMEVFSCYRYMKLFLSGYK